MNKLSILFVLAFLFSLPQAFSQDAGTIKGKVFSKSDDLPFIGVQVIIRQNDKILIGDVTDNDGSFTLKPLNPGKYTVTMKFMGYDNVKVTNVPVTGNKITFLEDVYMKASITEIPGTEIVGHIIPLIRKDGDLIDEFDSKKLVKTPDPTNLASNLEIINPQFQVDEETNEVRFRGSRNGETAFYIDGVRVSSLEGIPKASINNLKVYSGGIPARYGDFMGGVVVVETKSYFDWEQEQEALARMYADMLPEEESTDDNEIEFQENEEPDSQSESKEEKTEEIER